MRDMGGPGSTCSDEPDSASNLRELLNHPHVVEVLDALRHGPLTLADIRSHVHTTRRGLAVVLRIVAAHGLVARDDNGSWDTAASDSTVYRHTARGRLVVDALSRFSVWTTMFDGSTA